MSDPLSARTIDIQTLEAFEPLLDAVRYSGASGGRGSGKSHFFAEQLVEEAICGHVRVACMREIQNSIKDSVKQLLEDKINLFQAQHLFKITEREIVGPNDSLFIFRGLRNHTASSIKSLEGFNRAYYEEAQTLSQKSIDLATPTFRTGAQQRFSWNPELASDPVDKMFSQAVADKDPDFRFVHVDYRDNPWFPDELRGDMRRDRKRDIDKYNHIWLGQYLKNSEARVFKNWAVESFTVPQNASFLHGADWGYSVDPTVLVRAFIGRWDNGHAVYDPKGRCLFICNEKYKVGLELDHVPQFWDGLVFETPGAAREWSIVADSENPQAISYLRRHGYPKIQSAVKGKGSIKEGIQFLQTFDIVVHPSCVHTHDELTHFKYETDPLTGLVTPVLMEKKNHVIDSLRYAVEPVRRPAKKTIFGSY